MFGGMVKQVFPWGCVNIAFLCSKSFQGSLPGDRPLSINFANKVLACVYGSMISIAPLQTRGVIMSHLTFMRVLSNFPPQI
jgi:hypothetical protein